MDRKSTGLLDGDSKQNVDGSSIAADARMLHLPDISKSSISSLSMSSCLSYLTKYGIRNGYTSYLDPNTAIQTTLASIMDLYVDL